MEMFPINPEQIASVSSDWAAAARLRKGARSPVNQMSSYLDAATRKTREEYRPRIHFLLTPVAGT
jgi:hypothetical protein